MASMIGRSRNSLFGLHALARPRWQTQQQLVGCSRLLMWCFNQAASRARKRRPPAAAPQPHAAARAPRLLPRAAARMQGCRSPAAAAGTHARSQLHAAAHLLSAGSLGSVCLGQLRTYATLLTAATAPTASALRAGPAMRRPAPRPAPRPPMPHPPSAILCMRLLRRALLPAAAPPTAGAAAAAAAAWIYARSKTTLQVSVMATVRCLERLQSGCSHTFSSRDGDAVCPQLPGSN